MNSVVQRRDDRRKPAAARSEVVKNIDIVLETMVKLKLVMKKKGLTRARAKCPMPFCSGTLHASLNGPKQHMHCACDRDGCNLRFME
jgi:hypothetical protein